jgi:hypothetical protein
LGRQGHNGSEMYSSSFRFKGRDQITRDSLKKMNDG